MPLRRPYSIRLPIELRRLLQKQARLEHRSLSSLILDILDRTARERSWWEIHKVKRPEVADA